MRFKPNRKFRRRYTFLFRRDPLAANLFLLLAELADEKGEIETDEKQLADLAEARFDDHMRYSI